MATIGIDLGTTNSLVSTLINGKPTLIPNALGHNMTPSVIAIDESGEIIVGLTAREMLTTHPDRTVSIFKPMMGSGKTYELGSKSFKVEELSALILQSLMADARNFFGDDSIDGVVISLPAYFNHNQRNAVKSAAKIAGLPLKKVISEPTAALLSYGHHLDEVGDDETYLVLDLGGGTFDVSLMELFEGFYEIKASAGDGRLGGEDFLKVLVQMFCQHHNLNSAILDEQNYQIITRECEHIKRRLSDVERVSRDIVLNGEIYRFTVTHQEFRDQCHELMQKFHAPVARVLKDTRINPQRINKVVLVGGASRMAVFQELVSEFFPGTSILSHENDYAVCYGAAIQAELEGEAKGIEEMVVADVTPFSLGVTVSDKRIDGLVFKPVIERNTPIPVSKHTMVYSSGGGRGLSVTVYQGESLNHKHNQRLGKLMIPTPWKEDDVPIRIKFTYDYNGLIIVDVTVDNYDISSTATIVEPNVSLSEEQIAEQTVRLAELRTLPRDKAENKHVIAKLERLYEETVGEERSNIYDYMMYFQAAIRDEGGIALMKKRKDVENFLNQYNFVECAH